MESRPSKRSPGGKANKSFALAALLALTGLATLFGAGAEDASPASPLAPLPAPCRIYFGTGTTGPRGGIFVSDFDEATGALTPARLAAVTSHPVFLAAGPGGRVLYALGDVPQSAAPGLVRAFAVDRADGGLTFIGDQPSGGPEPCHLSVDPDGRWVFTANYNGGYLSVFPTGAGGAPGPAACVIRHAGSGPNRVRQEAPHVHSVNLDPTGRFVLSPDLGLDRVYIDRLDAATGSLAPGGQPFVRVPPGYGPRHLAFSPSGRFVYVSDEMGSAVSVFAWDGGRGVLTPIQTVGVLDAGYSGTNTTAEVAVHPAGRFLYVSNRGDDSLMVFAIDPASGRLSRVQRMAQGLRHPRHFALDPSGRWLVCANRDANDAVEFAVDPATGRLSPTGQAASVPSPMCVRFVVCR